MNKTILIALMIIILLSGCIGQKEPYIKQSLRITNRQYEDDRHAYYDVSPWSPDNSKIIWSSAKKMPYPKDPLIVSSGNIYIMDADGANIKKVADGANFYAHNGAYPIWGKDGKKIYFIADYGTGLNIYSVDIYSLEKVKIIPLDGLDFVHNLMLSPDGTQIAFTAFDKEKSSNMGIMIVGIDGTNLQSFSGSDVANEYVIAHPKWSPNGEKLIYTFWYCSFNVFRVEGCQRKELWVINRDGTGKKVLVPEFGHHAIWSPNGVSILFNDHENSLWTVDMDGNLNKITDYEIGYKGIHPSYNPDMSKIVTDTMNQRGEYNSVMLINPMTGEKEIIVSLTSKTNPHPVWSSDGSKILYDSDETGDTEIYIVLID